MKEWATFNVAFFVGRFRLGALRTVIAALLFVAFCICIYFLFASSGFYLEELWNNLSSVGKFNLFSASFTLVLLLFIFIISTPSRQIHRTEWAIYSIAIGVIAFVLIIFVKYMSHDLPPDQAPKYSAAAILASATIALIGWLTGHYLTIRNHRMQHTLNILLQMRQSDLFNKYRIRILDKFPDSVAITADDIEEILEQHKLRTKCGEDSTIMDAITYTANYYEFIASGIRRGDLDKEMVRLTHRGIIINFFGKISSILAYYRYTELPPHEKTKLYENLIWLVAQWDKQKIGRFENQAKELRDKKIGTISEVC